MSLQPRPKRSHVSKYDDVILWVFQKRHRRGSRAVAFERDDLADACKALRVSRVKNLGDIPYTFRFRRELPRQIQDAAPRESEWIIESTGQSSYRFRLAQPGKISPSTNRDPIKIPDATPEIVRQYAPGTDEQALLTRVRYNRLVDLFTGLTCYSIQNHLRTTVEGVGQIEVDEIYFGVSRKGAHYAIPCQAKSPGDRFGIVQVMQDTALVVSRYPNAICKPIALQFTGENDVAMLELVVREDGDLVKLAVVDERHYRLVPRSELSEAELARLRRHE